MSACRDEGTGEITDGLGAAMDLGVAHFGEPERCMEGVRCRVGRLGVHFAHDKVMARGGGIAEKILVQAVRQAALAHGRGDDDAVDIDEARIARAEPEVVGAVVVGVLVEGDEEGGDVARAPGVEGLAEKVVQPRGVEPGKLDGMVIVEGEEGGLVACGNAGQLGQAFVSFRNLIRRRPTSAACSCCTQWPAPSTMWISFMLVQALFCIFSSAPGDW